MQYLKYLLPFLYYVAAYFAFTGGGLAAWLPVLGSFVLIPLLEVLLPGNPQNLSATEEALAKEDKIYDYLLFLIVPCQYAALVLFLYVMAFVPQTTNEIVGRTFSMGVLCGVMGINVGHELGHRVAAFEQFLAKCLLGTSLYIHFFIEHNKGHHKNVATPADPSSARYNEPVYTFYFRTITQSYLSAWHIANAEVKKKNAPTFSLQNEMVQAHITQGLLLVLIGVLFNATALFAFIAAAFIGILLLETVNYIEHYGLQRRQNANGSFERAMPWHSWNSSHVVGRVVLFELTRHSDHHYMASRKYQVLKHYSDAPQLPTGYPGSMLLSLLPPLWFKVMNKKIDAINAANP
jgi:alkane 1-monooxygenase